MRGRRWWARIAVTALLAAALVVPVATPSPVAADPHRRQRAA